MNNLYFNEKRYFVILIKILIADEVMVSLLYKTIKRKFILPVCRSTDFGRVCMTYTSIKIKKFQYFCQMVIKISFNALYLTLL